MEQPIAALAQRNRELTILNTIAHQLNGSTELSAALAVALEQITAHFDLQTGWIDRGFAPVRDGRRYARYRH